MLVMGKILICRHCADLKDHKSKREEAILFCEEAMAGGPWLNDEPGTGGLGTSKTKSAGRLDMGGPHLREDHQL